MSIPGERLIFSPDMYEMVHMERIKGTDEVLVRRWQAGDWPFPRAAIQHDCRLVSTRRLHKTTAKRMLDGLIEQGWQRG